MGGLGVDGRGSASAARRLGQVDVTVGTLGKAFGAAGAFVYGSGTLIQYLMNRARSFIFSTAMMPAQAAAAREALRMIRFEPTHRENSRQRHPHDAHAARCGYSSAGRCGLAHRADHDRRRREAVMVGAQLATRGYLVVRCVRRLCRMDRRDFALPSARRTRRFRSADSQRHSPAFCASDRAGVRHRRG